MPSGPITGETYGWYGAGEALYIAWDRFSEATTPVEAASRLVDLSNAVHDVISWLPNYNYERGVLKGYDDAPE